MTWLQRIFRKTEKLYELRPLTAEETLPIPTSLLLLDVVAHANICGGTCAHCAPKLAELDQRLPPRAD